LLRRAKNLEYERQIMLARIATMLEQIGAQYYPLGAMPCVAVTTHD
jgi:hypothetical protein